MMACLAMLAFTVEAQFNFLGFKLKGKDWNEGAAALKKVHTVLEHLKVDNDLSARPYKTIVDLKNLRDLLAHGKPKEINKKEENWHASEEELRKEGALNADYEAFVKDEFVFQAYDDVDAIWKDLIKRAQIDFVETITAGGVEYTITQQANK